MPELPTYQQQTSMQPVDQTRAYTGTVIGDTSAAMWGKLQGQLDTTLDQMAVEQGRAAGARDQANTDPNAEPKSAGWLLGMTTAGRAYNEAAQRVLNIQKEGQLAGAAFEAVNKNPTDPAAANADYAEASKRIISNVPFDMSAGVSTLQTQYKAQVDRQVQQNVVIDQKGQEKTALLDRFNQLVAGVRALPEGSPEYALQMGQAVDLLQSGAKAGLITQDEARSQRDQLNFFRILGVAEKQINSRGQLDDLMNGKIKIAGADTLPIGMRLHLQQYIEHDISRKEAEARHAAALARASAAEEVTNATSLLAHQGIGPSDDQIKKWTRAGIKPEVIGDSIMAAQGQWDVTNGKYAGMPASEAINDINTNLRPAPGDPSYARKAKITDAMVQSIQERASRSIEINLPNTIAAAVATGDGTINDDDLAVLREKNPDKAEQIRLQVETAKAQHRANKMLKENRPYNESMDYLNTEVKPLSGNPAFAGLQQVYEQGKNIVEAREVHRLSNLANDSIAQVGAIGKPILTQDDMALIKSKDPNLAEKIDQEHEIARKQFEIMTGKNAGKTSAEIAKDIEDPSENDPNYAAKAKLAEAQRKALMARDEAANKDPMGLAYAGNTQAAMAFQSPDPLDVRAAIMAGTEKLTRMGYGGLAAENPLPMGMAKGLAKAFTDTPDEKKGEFIDQVKARYGDFAQPVMGQIMRIGKVDPGLQIAMTIPGNTPMEQSNRTDLMAALRLPKAEINKNARLEDPALNTSFQMQVTNYVGGAKGLAGTFTAQGADSLAFATVDAVERLAKLYIARGIGTTDAIDKAYKIVSSGFDVSSDGRYRVPAGTLDNARAMTLQAGSQLEPSMLQMTMPRSTEFTEKEHREQMLNRIRSTGYWITNPSGTGLRMVYQPLPGLVRPVVVNDGLTVKEYELSYKDIRSYRPGAAPVVDPINPDQRVLVEP